MVELDVVIFTLTRRRGHTDTVLEELSRWTLTAGDTFSRADVRHDVMKGLTRAWTRGGTV